MNEKNERNLDSTVDEIMEEIRDQTVSEVKDINEKEQKSEERPRKKKVTKTKRPSGHHVSGDGVDHAEVRSIPENNAKHLDAAIIHEAAIGRINDEQLIKLRTLGMTEEEAEGVIIENFLN